MYSGLELAFYSARVLGICEALTEVAAWHWLPVIFNVCRV